MNRVFRPSLFLLALLGLGGWSPWVAHGQDSSVTEPQDLAAELQGEYVATFKMEDVEVTLGVQVIALGNQQFEAVVYLGGLPGAGWNGEPPTRTAGTLQDQQVVFKNEAGSGILQSGQMEIRNPEGEPVATAKKVQRQSPTLGQPAPEGAIVLFDGTSVDGWKGGQMTEEGWLQQGTTSEATFGDHQLHIEFLLPFQPEARGQGRGNSGIYLQGRYEVQMLDSFGLKGEQNECGGLYSVKAPDVNMCLPPATWQTYDIDFVAAKYDEAGQLQANPRVTVRHNGVVIHESVELPGDRSTTAAPVSPGPGPGPVYLQDHGNPVRYRNIWVVPGN